jgi:eukaryotic-like serine/threonine-protein kinase
MKKCPTKNDLQGLLTDRLADDVRTSVEGHVEACPACQRQLDALTQSDEFKLAAAQVTVDSGPAFLQRVQGEYPATLLNAQAAKETLHFPAPATKTAPLGQVGDFDILEELGSGSFGWVFRARERSLKRVVALKVLKPEMTARPDALLRFEREAKKAAIKHDHVVNVYRFEKPTGFPPYLVMEFVEGETLEARLKREGKLTPEEAAAIARQIALGLAAAHEHGMVHRDIKPANILLDKKTGRAKISDFGLARDIANESMAVTAMGELAGTAPYMSPEHFRAPEKVDGRSDVFSLGIVLYQLVTGQLPFKGTFLQVRSGILEDEPTAPRKLRDSIPVDLETITLACLEKDPSRRYATAQAVAEDLGRFQNGEPILCRPTGKVERTVKWMYRKPAQAALVGVGSIAVLILAVLIVGFFVNAQLQAVNTDLTNAEKKLKVANGELEIKQAYVQRLNYVADMNLAHQAWQTDNFELLDQFLTAYDNSDLRGFEWHYLRRLSRTDGRRLNPKSKVATMAFDATGRYLAMAVNTDKSWEVQVWQPPSAKNPAGELLHTLAVRGMVAEVSFHPDQETLITSDGIGVIAFWNFKKGQRTKTLEGRSPLAVSFDGEQLAYVRPDGAVQRYSFSKETMIGDPLVYDARNVGGDGSKGRTKGAKPDDADKGKPRGNNDVSAGLMQLAFSADGQRLAAVGGEYKIRGAVAVWDLKNTKRFTLEQADADDLMTTVAFSPDGNSLAAAGFDHVLRVWDAKTGKLRFRRPGHKLEVLSVAFNAAGNLLASAGWDKVVRLWNAHTGEEIGSLRGNRGVVTQVLFAPSTNELGQENLVSLNEFGDVRWWDTEDEQSARVTRFTEPVHTLAFSPKGRYLASIGRSSKAVIQDLVKADERFDLPSTSPGARALFSREENALFTVGIEGTLQGWPFAKDATAVDVPNVAAVSGPRVVLHMDGSLFVSQSNPSANEPLRDVIPFGTGPKPAVAAVDAAGDRLAYVRDGSVIVVRDRDKETGNVTERTMQSPAKAEIKALAFSPDGRYLASGQQDYSVLLWNASTGELKHILTGHLCFVSCVAFSPDGKRLVSGSEDWTVKIWDIDVGRATLTLTGHKGRIRDLAFSPDGKLLASASEDMTVRIWPAIGENAEMRRPPREPKGPSAIQRGGK